MYSLRVAPLIILALTLSFSDVAAQHRRYAVVAGGEVCGLVDVDVTKLRNGYIEYKLRETRTLITADNKRQEYVRNSNCLADASLKIISVESAIRQGGAAITIKGSVVDGTMYITKDLGKGRLERWREDCDGAVLDMMLPELTRRTPSELPKRLFRLQDFRSVVADLRIETDTNGQRFVISQAGREFWYVSADGALLRHDIPALTISWEAWESNSPRPAPCRLNAGVEWDAGAAALPTTADNIRSLRATIGLKSQVGATLSPEDARQHIEPGSASDGNSVSVSVTRRLLKPEALPLPVLDKVFIPFVKGDSSLTLDGESVRRRANSLKAWERSSDVVINSLSGTIRREFVEDPFVPLVTAASIADVPRGSSIHASLLLVAVARAVGLPARFVLGVAPVSGRWTSKVWVEVWSGDWLPVDAIAGEVISDAAHIKLLDAVSLQSILDQSARLKNSLTLRVDSVVQVDTSETTKLETAILGSTYTNRTYKCAVTAPSAEWLIEERVRGDEIAVHMSPLMGSPVEFEVLLFTNVLGQDAEDLLGARLKALQMLLDNMSIQQRGEVRIADRRAPTVTYSYSKRNGALIGTRFTTAHCMLVDGSRGFLFTFSAPEEEFESFRPDLERVMKEFKLHR